MTATLDFCCAILSGLGGRAILNTRKLWKGVGPLSPILDPPLVTTYCGLLYRFE